MDWDKLKKQYWEKYPDDNFWESLKTSPPEDIWKMQIAPGDIPDYLKAFWQQYQQKLPIALEEQRKTQAKVQQEPETETETEKELPGVVDINGKQVQVDWAELGTYTDQFGEVQVIRAPILPMEDLNLGNIQTILEQVFPDKYPEWVKEGFDANKIYQNSTYYSILNYANINDESIKGIPGLQNYIINWANKRMTGELLYEGWDSGALTKLQQAMSVGGIPPTEGKYWAERRTGFTYKPTPGGHMNVYLASEITPETKLKINDVVIAKDYEEAKRLGAAKWFPEKFWKAWGAGEQEAGYMQQFTAEQAAGIRNLAVEMYGIPHVARSMAFLNLNPSGGKTAPYAVTTGTLGQLAKAKARRKEWQEQQKGKQWEQLVAQARQLGAEKQRMVTL